MDEAMSKSLNSPTSRLLQSSRLFSLPRPLPQPSLETATSTGVFRASESATLPYPTHQTIATPAPSHFRGDWGLKRPLPSKATRNTSTPHIRVRQQDNAAHITDFGSAADHSLTLAKWEQMGVPLIAGEVRTSFTNRKKSMKSVYDDDIDNTDRNYQSPQQPGQAPRPTKRWKYNGPWLPGLQPGEFEIWAMGKIAKRKDEFREFLMDRVVTKRIQEEQRALRDRGEGRSVSELRKVQLRKEITDNFDLEEKRMRDDHAVQHLSSELTSAICDFLDLPPVSDSQDLSGRAKSQRLLSSLSAYVTSYGPPSTHPAAGLSHIRTYAFLENHPLWGPQARRAPVLARVVRPRNGTMGVEFQAKLGVGGVVTNDPISSSYQSRTKVLNPDDDIREVYKDVDRMVNQIEPDLPGGNKIWVHPEVANVDEQGRIRLEIARGDQEAIAVAENNVEHIHRARNPAIYDGYTSMHPPGTAANANYGFSLSNTRTAAPAAPRTEGFDTELRNQSTSSQRSVREQEMLSKIQELSRSRAQPKT